MPSYVFTNLAISFDGKIATKNREHVDPSRYDRKLMDYHRSRCDVVVMGAATLRAFRRPAIVERQIHKIKRRIFGKTSQPANAILTSKADFDLSWPFFLDASVRRILIVPQAIEREVAARFKGLAEIIAYETEATMVAEVLGAFSKQGLSRVLLEGGGGIMFPWVEHDVVDEWNVTVSSTVIGGKDAPTMVEGEGFSLENVRSFRLSRCFSKMDQVFLQYKRR